MKIRIAFASLVLAAFVGPTLARAADAKPTPIAEVKHDGPVNFEKEILPILKKNCTACHNAAKAESDLSLENPAAILKGGSSGPGAAPKKGAESLIVVRAAAPGDEAMPPLDNKVGAKQLTSQELGLLKLWIDQGATGEVTAAEKISWQPLPPGVHPIYAAALSPDGQYVAASRANQIFIYYVPTGRLVGRLTDPALLKSGIYDKPGVADLDLIQSLAFSPDGSTLASGGFRTIKLWQKPQDVKSPLWADLKPAAAPQAVATSNDGKLVALAIGNEVQLADSVANKVGAKLTGHKSPVAGVAVSPDGAKVATVSADKTVRIWTTDGKPYAAYESPAELTAVAFTADGLGVVAGAADGKLRLYEVPAAALSGDPVPLPKAPEAPAKGKPAPAPVGPHKNEWASAGKKVTAVATFPGNPAQIVSGDEQGNIAVWNVTDAKGKAVKSLAKAGGEVRAVAVRADGAKIAAIDVANALRIWNFADGKVAAESKGDVRAIRKVQDLERRVAVAKAQAAGEKTALTDAEKVLTTESDAAKKAEEGKVAAEKALKEKSDALKKAEDDKAKADAEQKKADDEAKKAEAAKAAAEAEFAKAEQAEKDAKEKADKDKAAAKVKELRTKQQAAVTAAAQATAKAKAAATAVERLVKPLEDATKAKNEADSVLKSSDRAIASTKNAAKRAADAVPLAKKRSDDAEAAVKAKETELETAKKEATAAEKPFRSLAFSADGKVLVAGGDDNLVHTFNADNAVPYAVYVGHTGPVLGVTFSGEDKIISVSADKTATAWTLYPEWTWSKTIGDPSSNQFVDRVTALDFSPDGKLLASGGGSPSRSGELKIWNVADGALVREVADAHSDTVFSVRFSPDGKQLASGAADKFMKVFVVADGKFVRGFEGHTHHVLGVAWSPDGRQLASGGADNVVKLWDVATGEQKKTIQGFGKEVTGLTYLAGTDLVASCGDKTVRTVVNGNMGKTLAGPTDFVYCVTASLDGNTVAAGGQDGVLRIWDVKTGTETRNFPPPADPSTQQAQK
jgi:WD40 repeat protein